MKKIIALLLALTLVFGIFMFTSCDITGGNPNGENPDNDGNGTNDEFEELNGKTPEEIYAEALAKLGGLTNYTVVSNQVIDMKMNGQTMRVNQEVISKVNGQDSYVKISNDMPETAGELMEIWYISGWYYCHAAGIQYKAELAYEDVVNKYMPEGATSDSALLNIPSSWFKDIKFTKDGDDYALKFIVSGEEYSEFINNQSGIAYDSVISDVEYTAYFTAAGELKNIRTVFDYTVSGTECHADTVSTVSDVGTTSIVKPDGADDYQDYTGIL